jgi:hypothetical protein
MIVATIATIPLDLILVPWTDKRFDNGAIGGALAYVVTEGFVLTVALVFIAPQLLRLPSTLRLARTVLAGAGMFAAIWPLRDTFILIPIAVGAVVYLVGIAVLRVLGARDLAMLVRIVRRDPELLPDA